MKEGKASRSAAMAALFRALESIRPDNERVLYDAYSMQLLGGVNNVIFNTRFHNVDLLIVSAQKNKFLSHHIEKL